MAVRTLQGLAGRRVMAGPSEGEELGEERIRRIEESVGVVVGETFMAAVGAGSGFQVSLGRWWREAVGARRNGLLTSLARCRHYQTHSRSLASTSWWTTRFRSTSLRSTRCVRLPPFSSRTHATDLPSQCPDFTQTGPELQTVISEVSPSLLCI